MKKNSMWNYKNENLYMFYMVSVFENSSNIHINVVKIMKMLLVTPCVIFDSLPLSLTLVWKVIFLF